MGVNDPASWLPTLHFDLLVFILVSSNVIAIRSTSTVFSLVPCLLDAVSLFHTNARFASYHHTRENSKNGLFVHLSLTLSLSLSLALGSQGF